MVTLSWPFVLNYKVQPVCTQAWKIFRQHLSTLWCIVHDKKQKYTKEWYYTIITGTRYHNASKMSLKLRLI